MDLLSFKVILLKTEHIFDKNGGQQHNRKHVRVSPYFIDDIMQSYLKLAV